MLAIPGFTIVHPLLTVRPEASWRGRASWISLGGTVSAAPSESGVDELLSQRLEKWRARVSEWINRFRAGGAAGWLLFSALFAWKTPLWMLGVYLVLALALWFG